MFQLEVPMRRFAIVFAVSLLTWSCASSTAPNNGDGENGGTNNGSNSSSGGCEDLDGDGYDGRNAQCNTGRDCDDSSAQVSPDADEVCGDRKDNDCDSQIDEGCDSQMDCIDRDGDRYGEGPGCFGPDCDDDNPVINPSAMEICGDEIDQNCDGMDLECPTNCIDEDGDGYGAPGSTDCMGPDGEVNEEIDCDDDNPDAYPGAEEVCDGADNNCNDVEDECPLEGQSCSEPGGECQGGLGAECENETDCAGENVTCDTNTDPKVCRSIEGGDCDGNDDCVEGLTCGADDTCTGNFCDPDPCSGNPPYDVCDREGAACVECPHFDPDPQVQDDACDTDGEQCTPGGWCALNFDIRISGLSLDISAPEEAFWLNVAMADCWNNVRPDGEKDICWSFFVSNDVSTVTEQIAEDAYVNGDLDEELFMEENDALNDIWGEGLFNLKEIDWETDLEAGTAKEVCLWYQPGGGLFSGESLVLDKCENFTP